MPFLLPSNMKPIDFKRYLKYASFATFFGKKWGYYFTHGPTGTEGARITPGELVQLLQNGKAMVAIDADVWEKLVNRYQKTGKAESPSQKRREELLKAQREALRKQQEAKKREEEQRRIAESAKKQLQEMRKG